MAKNTLTDLNNHLFAQLERLSDESLTGDALQTEIERTKAVNGVAKNIIDNARTSLEGVRIAYENLPSNKEMPVQFRIKE